MALQDKLRWLGNHTLWAYRILTWGVLAAGFVFAVMVIALRYWFLPNVEQYRDDIVRIVNERSGQKVAIGRIHGNWDGLRPQLNFEQVTVFDNAGRPALELSRVDNTLSWLSLAAFELRFHALDIYNPTLNIRRDARGAVSIAGIELTGKGQGGFADWLLRQRDIEVHDASVVWTDELRGAPPLELKNVFIHLYTRGQRHRFGLRAVPPRELAAPIDLRGELRGRTIEALESWNGKFFLQLEYADIAAWRTWIPFPVEFPRGAGALRAWLTFSQDRLVEFIADVRLADVITRLARDLPQFDLSELSGRVGWKQSDSGFELTTSRLGLTTTGGLTLPPADFLLRLTRDGNGELTGGELRGSALELAPLAAIAEHLPLAQEARQRLAAFSPKGGIYDLTARWSGPWREPRQYSVRGRFQNLSLLRAGRIPGFTGVSGIVEASEKGGTLSLNSHRANVDMPLVFREPLEFEALAAQVTWTRSGSDTELKFNQISFSNSHVSGNVFGNYRPKGSVRGHIDLTGNLTRADARHVGRYIPLVVGPKARDWLDNAFLAGQGSDVSLRLKGNLDEFPFPENRGGVFQVAAKVTGGELHYANGWPDIRNISGDLLFRGRRMDVNAREGAILGARLSKVHVEIPDLLKGGDVLNVRGEAEGPTGEFFSFIDKSPVTGMIDHFTEGWQAQGNGRLALKLTIPLGADVKPRVAGTYQFANNAVTILPALPAIEQAGGRVEFTETSVRAQNLAGLLLGGPVSLSAATDRGASVRVTAQGRINTDKANRAGAPQWTQHLRGTADWRAVINARKRDADVVVESNLQGLAVDFPAPFTKTSAEAVPLRFERRQLAQGQDHLSLAFGDVVNMNLTRRAEEKRTAITRGVVRFGGAAAEAERPGVWVMGTVKELDLDRVLALFDGGGDTRIEWAGIDLRVGALDLFRRRFNDLAIYITHAGGQWRGNVTGGEMEGGMTWSSAGRGKLTARMKTFSIPSASPAAAQAPSDAAARPPKEIELPALDIVADQFVNKGKQLGRLELGAASEGREWRIDKLRIVNPESTFTLDGTWQLGPAQPRTQINLKLEASDVGKLLTRLGYPEGVRRGTTKLEGALAWSGAPYELDYPSMTGNLVVEAAKGQFVKLDPGIGKLLGILSLQALPRRVTLDFRDVFSDGFAFDEIVGAVKINRGVAGTENFRISGPAARVTMSGDVDLARETQKLKVRVTPHVSDGVSIAGALVGGPIAGVAAFIAQKVLKDPLDQMVSYEYGVTGTWSEPSVARLERQATAQEPVISQ